MHDWLDFSVLFEALPANNRLRILLECFKSRYELESSDEPQPHQIKILNAHRDAFRMELARVGASDHRGAYRFQPLWVGIQ